MYDLTLLKATNFGNNDRVWNIPSPTHDFTQYEKKEYKNIIKRLPLLATGFIVSGEYTDDLKEYDYLMIKDLTTNKIRYYFVDGITGDRNIILISVILDTFTTYELLSTPITGTLIRKHDTNLNETAFDYPTALQYNPMYEEYRSDVVGFPVINGIPSYEAYIESSVDLLNIPTATTIQSNLMKNVTIPILKRPKSNTKYVINIIDNSSSESTRISDNTGALTLYLSNTVSESNLDTLRGLSGDGAISDSFLMPTSGVIADTSQGGLISLIRADINEIETDLPFKVDGYIPKNRAIEGLFKVEISSMGSGDTKTFPSWTLTNSLSINNNLIMRLWCDPKPSGNPFCGPKNPPKNIKIPTAVDENKQINILYETILKTSVKGSQWLKNPLVYNTGNGEVFASVETQLQRDKSSFEMNSAMTNLEISQREKDIKIAQQKYNYEASQTMGLLGIAGDLISGDVGGALGGVNTTLVNNANQTYIKELQALKNYEGSKQAQLIKIAHSNNLKSLNVQEKIRQIVTPEVVHRENDSLKGYNIGNDFRVTIIQPDIETLRLKDMEYSLYGYPIAENVESFVMTENLRVNHSVFQFSECMIEIGGDIGDITREFLRSGIRILSSKYSINNLITNPKKVI